MANYRKQKSTASSSRYWTTQAGAEYKWRISSQRLECTDNKGNIVATWDKAQQEEEFHARVTVKRAGLPFITEILTTLVLTRIALTLNW